MAAERTNVSNDLIWSLTRTSFWNWGQGLADSEQATRMRMWFAATLVVAPSSPGTL